MYERDTIAAISTAAGEGGIGIVRLSGPDSLAIAQLLFRRDRDGGLTSHRFSYGHIHDPLTGEVVDEVMLVYMAPPRTYTREPVVEIQCHGGTYVVDRLLQLVLAQGARLARPGEFTRRAFLNGRIDLLQAEAVIDLIRSKSEASLALAQRQSQGLLSERFALIRQQLITPLALMEAYLDFPDDEVGELHAVEIDAALAQASDAVDTLLSTFTGGRLLRDGIAVVIAGRPNVGKSSLLNTLLRERRAIVTPIPGTTRDVIEEYLNIDGVPIRLLDTAGVRETSDIVEQEGVSRTLAELASADLVLFVIDGSAPFTEDDQRLHDHLSTPHRLLVINKSDLPQRLQLPASLVAEATVAISTQTGAGLDELRRAMVNSFFSGADRRESVSLNRARHRDTLERVQHELATLRQGRSARLPLELQATDLRQTLHILGEVTGETTPDEILDHVFSSFCVGK